MNSKEAAGIGAGLKSLFGLGRGGAGAAAAAGQGGSRLSRFVAPAAAPRPVPGAAVSVGAAPAQLPGFTPPSMRPPPPGTQPGQIISNHLSPQGPNRVPGVHPDAVPLETQRFLGMPQAAKPPAAPPVAAPKPPAMIGSAPGVGAPASAPAAPSAGQQLQNRLNRLGLGKQGAAKQALLLEVPAAAIGALSATSGRRGEGAARGLGRLHGIGRGVAAGGGIGAGLGAGVGGVSALALLAMLKAKGVDLSQLQGGAGPAALALLGTGIGAGAGGLAGAGIGAVKGWDSAGDYMGEASYRKKQGEAAIPASLVLGALAAGIPLNAMRGAGLEKARRSSRGEPGGILRGGLSGAVSGLAGVAGAGLGGLGGRALGSAAAAPLAAAGKSDSAKLLALLAMGVGGAAGGYAGMGLGSWYGGRLGWNATAPAKLDQGREKNTEKQALGLPTSTAGRAALGAGALGAGAGGVSLGLLRYLTADREDPNRGRKALMAGMLGAGLGGGAGALIPHLLNAFKPEGPVTAAGRAFGRIADRDPVGGPLLRGMTGPVQPALSALGLAGDEVFKAYGAGKKKLESGAQTGAAPQSQLPKWKMPWGG
jgi:hypothetical protein